MGRAAMSDRNWLFRGTVAHTRLTPRKHAFRYPAFFICFPLSCKQEMQSTLFGLDRFNLFSFHEHDHGDHDNSLAWIKNVLANEGLGQANGEIWLMTMPRLLGFVFNPVNFWWCHDRDGHLRALLCEVSNTFGERHCYLLTAASNAIIDENTSLQTRKIFHVSPFLEVKGHYRFRFSVSSARRTVAIDYIEDGTEVLKTVITGQAFPLCDRELLRTFFSFGHATLMVVLRINLQALALLLKGISFHRKPSPPSQEISR